MLVLQNYILITEWLIGLLPDKFLDAVTGQLSVVMMIHCSEIIQDYHVQFLHHFLVRWISPIPWKLLLFIFKDVPPAFEGRQVIMRLKLVEHSQAVFFAFFGPNLLPQSS